MHLLAVFHAVVAAEQEEVLDRAAAAGLERRRQGGCLPFVLLDVTVRHTVEAERLGAGHAVEKLAAGRGALALARPADVPGAVPHPLRLVRQADALEVVHSRADVALRTGESIRKRLKRAPCTLRACGTRPTTQEE